MVKKGRKGRWLWWGAPLGLGLAAAGTLLVMERLFVPTPVPGTVFQGVALAGKDRAGVLSAVEGWWGEARGREVVFRSETLGGRTVSMNLEDLGAELLIEETVGQVQWREFWRELLGEYREMTGEREVKPVVRFGEAGLEPLAEFVERHRPRVRPARAVWDGDRIVRTKETRTFELDVSRVAGAALAAFESGGEADLPLRESPKRIPDVALAEIDSVMGRFRTQFNAGDVARSANIRLAARQINGHVLMPGESFSFNEHLGERTTAKGYRVAGVYVSGRHDVDVGGGICQVSSTLYNAVLISGLGVKQRSPHSLPVPYVPLGRDAAVSYPTLDFRFTNTTAHPVALSAVTGRGSVEFVVLGADELDREVSFESRVLETWSHGEKVVHDGNLGYGVRKLVDKGGAGRRVQTWKVVRRGGDLVERRNLGVSVYRGGPRIVAVNKSAVAPVRTAPAGEGVGSGGASGGSIPVSSGEGSVDPVAGGAP